MNDESEKCNEDTIEDWKFNINRANEIVRLYGYQTAFFVKIILSLIVTYNILFVIFNIYFNFISFNIVDFWILMGCFIVYLISAIIALLFSIKKDNTKDKFRIDDTYCHFEYIFNEEGKITEEIPANLTKDNFRADYPKQLNNLLKFQKNYKDIALRAKTCMKINIIIFGICLAVSILVLVYKSFFLIN